MEKTIKSNEFGNGCAFLISGQVGYSRCFSLIQDEELQRSIENETKRGVTPTATPHVKISLNNAFVSGVIYKAPTGETANACLDANGQFYCSDQRFQNECVRLWQFATEHLSNAPQAHPERGTCYYALNKMGQQEYNRILSMNLPRQQKMDTELESARKQALFPALTELDAATGQYSNIDPAGRELAQGLNVTLVTSFYVPKAKAEGTQRGLNNGYVLRQINVNEPVRYVENNGNGRTAALQSDLAAFGMVFSNEPTGMTFLPPEQTSYSVANDAQNIQANQQNMQPQMNGYTQVNQQNVQPQMPFDTAPAAQQPVQQNMQPNMNGYAPVNQQNVQPQGAFGTSPATPMQPAGYQQNQNTGFMNPPATPAGNPSGGYVMPNAQGGITQMPAQPQPQNAAMNAFSMQRY